MSNYSEMTYADLKKLAVSRKVPAVGTKDELIAALTAADESQTDGNAGDNEETSNVPAPTTGKGAVSEQEVEREWRSDAEKMKRNLDSQPKVRIMIPLDPGVKPEDADKVPFTVNLNGYPYSIKRGVFVDVPQQIAEIVQERLESEGKIGNEHRIDLNPAKSEALV